MAVTCVVFILLIGFSRNFQGVHTPQDVFVGITESILVILAVNRIADKVEGNEKVLDILTGAGLLLTAAAVIYIIYKPYPMDYVDGALLVNPQSMMNDSFKAAGYLTGFLIGSFIERHYIHYEIPFGSRELGILSCIGAGLMITWKEYIAPATFVAWLGCHWGHFVARFLLLMFATVVWPLVIRKVCGSSAAGAEE